MAIEHEINIEDGHISAKASGKDDDLESTTNYSMSVYQAAMSSGIKRILCDERELIYGLGMSDTYALAKEASKLIPRDFKIAIVCGKESKQEGGFWETVSLNRGLNVKVFLDFEEAKMWLTG
jgi:hypothetical protein